MYLLALPLGSLARPAKLDRGKLQEFYTPDTTFEALTGHTSSQLASDTDANPPMSQSQLLDNAKKLLSSRLKVSEADLLVKTSQVYSPNDRISY